eukprot:TCONS_00053257-protein
MLFLFYFVFGARETLLLHSVTKILTMANDECSVCSKKITAKTFHFCPNCERRSHAKCLGVESKFLRNIWLCKLCRYDALPNLDSDENLSIGKDISHLKTYFKHLNCISDTFSNFDSQIDEQR